MLIILSLVIHTVLALPSPAFNEHIQAWRTDLCQSASGVDSKCAGTADVKASNILACPSQTSAVGILCGGANSKKEAGGLCFPQGEHQLGCYCTMGQFFCPDDVPTLPNGQSALEYFEESGCNCAGTDA